MRILKLIAFIIILRDQSLLWATPNCQKQLNHFLRSEKLSTKIPNQYGVKDWFRVSESQFQTLKFRRPLADSQWIDVITDQSCKIINSNLISDIKIEFRPNNNNDDFTDEQLLSLSKKNSLTLIYIWSPSMIYSMKEIAIAEKIARTLKIDFLPLHDNKYEIQPNNHRKLAGIGLSESILNKSKPQKSNYLNFSHQIHHYPLMFIVGKNKISKKMIAGVLPESIWRQELKSWSQNY